MIKRILCSALIGAGISSAFAADVGVSVTVGQPGFYGRIDIGNFPPPPIIFAQPVIIQRPPEVVAVAPIYLHVPPGHEKHWSKHCAHYHACDRPVYFVRDDWYNNVYVPHYQAHDGEHGKGDKDKHDRDHGKDHEKDHGDRDR